ncbi:MAG: PQQ-binding-like beta-propeller repeat protein, partial [Planctomycetales bacterium]|nr:PQQ-binding-like beta-propeller repeat protein [Planctomycetales bacterium]
LIWRFRGAPLDLRCASLEQIESVWPVHGSVLVTGGETDRPVATFVAGRSFFLDGGMRMIRLNAATGELIDESVLDDTDPDSGKDLQERLKILQMPVGLPDILSHDGKYTYMRSQPFDAAGKRVDVGPFSADFAGQANVHRGEKAHLFAPMGFLDDEWFHRSYWVFGRSFAGGHAGYYQAGKFAPSGRIIVCDDTNVYGFARKPEYYKWTTTMEHQLFATSKEPPPEAREAGDTLAPGNKAARRGQQPAGNSGMVRVANAPSLDPTGKALALSAWVNAAKPNGVIVARGGPARGYALVLEKGKPQFMVREGEEKLSVAAGGAPIGGRWTHLCGVLTADKKVQLYVNGKLAGEGGPIELITADPVQAMEIGGDEGGAVGNYESPHLLTGAVDEVRLFFGSLSEAEIAALSVDDLPGDAAKAKLALAISFDGEKLADSSGGKHAVTNEGAEFGPGKLGQAAHFTGAAQRGGKKPAGRGPGSFVEHYWNEDVPLLVRAMVKTGDTLFILGPPDLIDEETAFQKLTAGDADVLKLLARQDAAMQGAEGATLLAVDAKTGKRLAEANLPELPVWDGMAAAGGKLFVATLGGKVICLEAK